MENEILKEYPCLFINMTNEDIKKAAEETSKFREEYYKNNKDNNDFFEEV